MLNFDCVIILNGEIAKEDILLLKKLGITKIAADGAANTLFENEIIPDYIVGDFDSFNFTTINTQLVKLSSQEQYDFEKCLDFAISNNFISVLVLGLNGGLLDHTLNNCSIFIKYSLKMDLYCYAKEQIGKLVTKDISFSSKLDDIISIIPFPKATLTTYGLMWKLDNATLELGTTEGARNKAISDDILIKLHFGRYILFRNNGFL